MKFEVYDDELIDGEVGFISKEDDYGEQIMGVQFFTAHPDTVANDAEPTEGERGTITFWGLRKAVELFEQALKVMRPMVYSIDELEAMAKAEKVTKIDEYTPIDKTLKDE